MLGRNRVTGQLLDPALCHVTNCNHADSLPNAQPDTGSDTAVETSDAVVGVDVLEGVADSHLLGAVGVLLLTLHLDADDLDGLVPGAEATTQGAGQDLLRGAELLAVLLAGGGADPALGETAETETATPVCHLADGNGVDALVDTTDTLLAVDAHEGLEGGGGLDAGGGHLVLGDFDRLHAGAEAHGGVSLGDTADDAAGASSF
jgi:hypothetical protein